jgi:hypothetical protein
MHAIPLVTHMPPWVVDIIVVKIPAAAEFPWILVIAAAVVLLMVVLLTVFIVVLCRPAPKVRVNAFENLKFA